MTLVSRRTADSINAWLGELNPTGPTVTSWVVTTVLWLIAAVACGDDWPAFRGAIGDGRSLEVSVIPEEGAVSFRLTWIRDLGSAYSGIAVVGSRLVTQYSESDSDFLIALDATTGTTLWRLRLGAAYSGHDGSHSGPLATPAANSNRVVSLGAHGELVAADLATGELLWRRDLTGELKARKPHYGFSTSPRFYGDQVLLALGGYQQALASFDLADGSLRWAVGSDVIDYQSPVLWQAGGSEQVLLAGSSWLLSIDPRHGKELWRWAHEGAGTRGAFSLSAVPMASDQLFLAHRDDLSLVISVDPVSGPSGVAWQSRAIRNSYASPVIHQGHLFAYSSRFLSCVDAATGELLWRSREPGDGFPILVDGHLLIQAKDGGVRLVRASPSGYQERARMEVFDEVSWTSPSFSNGSLYSRSMRQIARLELDFGDEQRELATSSAIPPPLIWQRLLAEVESSHRPDKVIDRFLAAQQRIPIVTDGQVHFLYRGTASDVALAGDLAGARRELPLRRLGKTDLFFRSVEISPQAAFSYLFLVDYQPVVDPFNPVTVLNTTLGDDFEPVMGGQLEMSWFAVTQAEAPTPLVSAGGGTFKRQTLSSEALGRDLDLAIYTPAGYHSHVELLPVVVLLGGSEALRLGGYSQVLDRLMGDTLPDLLVVFVLENGIGALQPFAEMLANDLIPFVERHYRASSRRQDRALAGMGWEGLTAAYAGFAQSELFGHLALQSVYALTAPAGGAAAWAQRAAKEKPQIYLDWGLYDLRNSHEAWSTVEDNRRLFATLRQLGFETSGGEVPEGSGWASWRRRTERWLKLFFAD